MVAPNTRSQSHRPSTLCYSRRFVQMVFVGLTTFSALWMATSVHLASATPSVLTLLLTSAASPFEHLFSSTAHITRRSSSHPSVGLRRSHSLARTTTAVYDHQSDASPTISLIVPLQKAGDSLFLQLAYLGHAYTHKVSIEHQVPGVSIQILSDADIHQDLLLLYPTVVEHVKVLQDHDELKQASRQQEQWLQQRYPEDMASTETTLNVDVKQAAFHLRTLLHAKSRSVEGSASSISLPYLVSSPILGADWDLSKGQDYLFHDKQLNETACTPYYDSETADHVVVDVRDNASDQRTIRGRRVVLLELEDTDPVEQQEAVLDLELRGASMVRVKRCTSQLQAFCMKKRPGHSNNFFHTLRRPKVAL